MTGQRDELTELREQVQNLETQIYTLKTNLKTMFITASDMWSGPSGADLMNCLSVWANFELPSHSNSESGQDGTSAS